MKKDEASRGRLQGIDWDEVRKRLEAARLKIEQGWAPAPEERAEILRTRAKQLAQEPEEDDAGEKIEFVEFVLAGERYGLETSLVREVYPLKDLSPVPCTPAHVLGIINVRGRILSIVDLKKFFELPDKGLGDLNKVIILKSDAREFGVLADAITGVRETPLSNLQKSLPTFTGVREEYLKGITPDRVTILDAMRILSDEKLVVNEQVI